MKKYIIVLSVIATAVMSFSLQAETKISRVIHKEADTSGGGIYTNADLFLEYDSQGRLVHFLEYDSDTNSDPRFDIELVWNPGKVSFTGLIDYHECYGDITLNGDGLATCFTCEGGEEAVLAFTYDGKRLEAVSYPEEGESVRFSYQDDRLAKFHNPDYSREPMLIGYDQLIPCHIPHPILINNILFYYRFIAYAGLLGQPFDYFPTSYDRYGRGWKTLQTSLDDDGNVTSIIAPDGGLTHSAFEYEEFIYEYTTTNSIKEISYDMPEVSVDNGLVTITGKKADTGIELFDLLGHLVKTTTADTFLVDGKGLFIIKVGPHASKIHIR